MFDRIGRKEDETPFVVEWFVRAGVEVWSVHEGQQRFDNHVDKLMNYIRYWQASGESIKTSIRTKSRLGQIIQEGRFRGGTAPYGYHLEKQGRFNKKNHEVNEIVIDQDESTAVKTIFDLYVNHGYGTYRICKYLKDRGINARSGKNFTNTSIQHILQNKTYTGVLKSGDTISNIFPDLQIITPEVFERAQEIMRDRCAAYNERSVPLSTKGNALLSGIIFCGDCGSRLTITTSGKKRSDDAAETVHRMRYLCYNRSRYPGSCNGQSVYVSKKLDDLVESVARKFFSSLKDQPKEQLIKNRYENRKSELDTNLKMVTAVYNEHLAEMKEYESEALKVIRGESKLSAELINKLYDDTKTKVEQTLIEIKRIETEMKNDQAMQDSFAGQY